MKGLSIGEEISSRPSIHSVVETALEFVREMR